MPVLAAKYFATYDFVSPSLGWALIAENQNVFSPLPPQAPRFWVFRTTDGAKSWHKQFTGTFANVFAGGLQFFGQTNGIVDMGGLAKMVIYRTSDGGEHWSLVSLPNNTIESSFADPMDGWVAAWLDPNGSAEKPQLLSTADGGQTWTPRQWPASAFWPGNGILGEQHFRSDGEGWFGGLGLQAMAYSTPDGGNSWQTHAIPIAPGLFSTPPAADPNVNVDVTLLPQTGVLTVVTGAYGQQHRFTSFDHGETWKLVDSPPNATPYTSYLYVDDQHWWAMGAGSLSKTSDAGQTWTRLEASPPLETWFYSPHVIDAGHAWAQLTWIATSSSDSALVMSSDGGVSWTPVSVPTLS
jgi:photosystem II stability/assembly factor-like uncharacterized protein